jgi:integrase
MSTPTNYRSVNPHRPKNRPGYCVSFPHPQTKKRINRGLDTDCLITAKQICHDIERIINSPDCWNLNSPILCTLLPKSVEIFFEKSFIAPLPQVKIKTGADAVESFAEVFDLFDELVYEPYELLRERELRSEVEHKLQKLERNYQDALLDNASLRRAAGKHCVVPLLEAVNAWKKIYPDGRDRHTAVAAFGSVDTFVNFVKPNRLLTSIKAGDIDQWIEQYKGRERKYKSGETKKAKGDVSPITKRKIRAYLSVFFTWANKRYDLAENPFSKVDAIPGVGRTPEHIQAIRSEKDLITLLNSLKPNPYWRAWIALACLAGPRFSEQAWLRVSDVYIDNGYIRITSRSSGQRLIGTKTGLERNIPIEQTTLLPILKDYIASHDGVHPWLFSSTLPEGSVKRSESLPGQWSGTKAFHSALKPILVTAAADVNNKQSSSAPIADFWSYTPKHWRHCFGTALGHSGFNALEISRMMGNSADIAERHYIATLNIGKQWSFRWR